MINLQKQQKTHISNALEAAEDKAKYDAQVKKILADKNILAWILKYAAQEFRDFTIKEIMDSIEGAPEISAVPVYPGERKPEAVAGMANTDEVPNEGRVTFDIRFHVYTPGTGRIKLFINVEAQKAYHVAYDLVTRGIFYCARMLSAQMDTEFTGKDYDQIKKVYSIWICMDAPAYAANTITEYGMEQRCIYGKFGGKSRYDLLSVVMVCLAGSGKLGPQSEGGTQLHGLLSTVLSEELTPQEKERVLELEYGIAATREMKEGMRQMCNLSERIEEIGIEKGIKQGIEQGIEQGIVQGIEQGIEQGIKVLIESCKELGVSRVDTGLKLKTKYELSQEAAERYLDEYWK